MGDQLGELRWQDSLPGGLRGMSLVDRWGVDHAWLYTEMQGHPVRWHCGDLSGKGADLRSAQKAAETAFQQQMAGSPVETQQLRVVGTGTEIDELAAQLRTMVAARRQAFTVQGDPDPILSFHGQMQDLLDSLREAAELPRETGCPACGCGC